MLRSYFAVLVLVCLGCELACAAEAPPPPAPARHVAVALGPDTTVITAPLNPDGTPNYLAAINARLATGVTAENNAAVMLLQAMGPDAIFKREARAKIYAALHLASLPEEGPYFTDLARYAR